MCWRIINNKQNGIYHEYTPCNYAEPQVIVAILQNLFFSYFFFLTSFLVYLKFSYFFSPTFLLLQQDSFFLLPFFYMSTLFVRKIGSTVSSFSDFG